MIEKVECSCGKEHGVELAARVECSCGEVWERRPYVTGIHIDEAPHVARRIEELREALDRAMGHIGKEYRREFPWLIRTHVQMLLLAGVELPKGDGR